MAADGKKEQEMKEEINMYMRKKDYYDILGITRGSQQVEIKKAYKKLALRFHPDKNNVEGSKQVFKKVSNAYSNLIDPEKRASYDRYGPEEDREPRFRPQQRQYRQGYSQEDEFEDIFRAFFGGMDINGGGRRFTFNMGGPRQQAQAGNNGSGSMIYFLIFLVVIYVVPMFFPKEQPYHSAVATSVYKNPMKTKYFSVPYFVRDEYYSSSVTQQTKIKIQAEIDTNYVIRLKKQCDMIRYTKQAASKQIYRQSCQRFTYIQENYPQYLQSLFYNMY